MKTYATQTLMTITQVNGGDMDFFDDGKTKFYLDSDEVTAEKFNDFFYAHDVGWSEEVKDGVLHLTIFTDEAR